MIKLTELRAWAAGAIPNVDEAYAAVVHYTYHSLHRGFTVSELQESVGLQRLGNPHFNTKYIHVGGTNGKGSVVAKLTAGLLAGETPAIVGTFSSPHVASVRERIRLNGMQISRKDFVISFAQVVEAFEEDMHRMNSFAIYTVMAVNYFYSGPINNEKKPYCDFAVIEVGIGGLTDLTNIIIRPACAVVTSIGWDHMEHLGPTIEDIARQKAGIFKRNCPAVIGAEGAARTCLVECAKSVGATPVLLTEEANREFNEMNNATALLALEHIRGSINSAVISAVKSHTPLFRCDVIPAEMLEIVHSNLIPSFGILSLMDGGHNRTALAALARQLCSRFPAGKFCVFCSFSRKRGTDCLLDMYAAFEKCGASSFKFIYSGSKHPRIRKTAGFLEEYNELASEDKKKLEFCGDANDNFSSNLIRAYREAGEMDGVLVICGSFFILQEAASLMGIPLEDPDPLEFNEMTFDPSIRIEIPPRA